LGLEERFNAEDAEDAEEHGTDVIRGRDVASHRTDRRCT
jgi:hypothetical protein